MTENKIFLVLDVSTSVPKPVWSYYEILELDIPNNTLIKNVAKVEKNLNGGLTGDFLYYGDNKVIISYARNTTNYYYINVYEASLQMLDLETGDISDLGLVNPVKGDKINLEKIGNNVYAFVQNYIVPYSADIFKLSFSNIGSKTNQIVNFHFKEFNNQLFVTWAYGHPFDGTWNVSEDRLNNYVKRQTYYQKIAPSIGNKTLFCDGQLTINLLLMTMMKIPTIMKSVLNLLNPLHLNRLLLINQQ